MLHSGLRGLVLGVLLCSATATATGFPGETTPPELPPPPTWKGDKIDVVERLGERVPVDAKFRRHDGALVTLGSVLAGDLPTILTFNYADCPMLCSLQLNGFTAALPTITAKGPTPGAEQELAFRIGQQFRIVTVSLDPNESLERTRKMRDKYLARLPADQRAKAAEGWTFLIAERSGDASHIARVADAVGFKYVYLTERAEYAHPAALIFLSTKGAVTRYVYGIEYDAPTLRESIFRAGIAEPTTASGFMHRCYQYDPDANNYSQSGVTAMRVGAAGFCLLAGGMGFFLLRRARRYRTQPREPLL